MPWLRRRRGGSRAHLEGSGRCGEAVIDGGGSGKVAGGLVLAGEVWFVGGELRSFLGRAPTPASPLRRFWARNKEGVSAGGCGGNGEAVAVQRRERGRAARRGRDRPLLRCGSAQPSLCTMAVVACSPSWRCTGVRGVRGKCWRCVEKRGGAGWFL